MTYVIIREGVVIHCVSVDDTNSLHECYPDCLVLERAGDENIGWTCADGVFTEPK